MSDDFDNDELDGAEELDEDDEGNDPASNGFHEEEGSY